MTHWQERSKNWDKIGPPKRPIQEVIDQIRALVGDDANVLVLGVTPQLVQAFANIHAVDREPAMISRLWPGDTETKTAECLDWFDLPGNVRYDAIVGDGSLNMVRFSDGISTLLMHLMDLLKPGGRLACRVFSNPTTVPTLEDLMSITSGRTSMGFDAWRTKQSHHLTTYVGPNVPVELMVEFFDVHWPDREALAAATGWDLESINITMDAYRGSQSYTAFPTDEEWLSVVPEHACNVELIPTYGYELAENFPILTFTKATG